MTEKSHDLVVIGAGPGGYSAALRAAQLGLDTACVEREPLLGGTCLRVGCIPSKALLESSERYAEARGGATGTGGLAAHGIAIKDATLDLAAMQRRKDGIVAQLTGGIDGLFRQRKVARYTGVGRFEGPGVVAVTAADGTVTRLRAGRVIIATGSAPADLPNVVRDGRIVGDSTVALAFDAVPRRLTVIGAGYIGLELGSVWRRLGAEVTVVEYLDRILPGTDAEIAREALKALKRQGLEFVLGAAVTAVEIVRAKGKAGGARALVSVAGRDPLEADRVLVAVGRRPHTEGLGLEMVGIPTDERGFIPVDADFRTAAPGVFAIGDVIGGPLLAHKAADEGAACAERLAGRAGYFDRDIIPSVCYTDPEIAAVGKTEEHLRAAGVAFRKGVVPFRANGRALALDRPEGRVKVLADAHTDRVLGVHVIGPRAGDLIAEAAAAMAFGASSEDLALVCHAHPTLSEAVKEAALAAGTH